ncbi:MAG: N-6 DNA methylase [Patescibacteria group bacterium]
MFKKDNYKTSIKNIKALCLAESSGKALIKSQERQKELGEVFTPTELVLDILKKLPTGKDGVWQEGKTFLDPACGNGQFLVAILIIKIQLGHENPLESIYGVDIMLDNVKQCRGRLLLLAGDTKKNRAILKKNIVCKDGLEFDYEF